MNFYLCILFCIGITYVRKAYKEDMQHLEDVIGDTQILRCKYNDTYIEISFVT